MLKKIVIGIVQGDQFLSISLKCDYKVGSWCYSVFLFPFPIPLSDCSPFFYTIFPFHLYPPRAGQIGWS